MGPLFATPEEVVRPPTTTCTGRRRWPPVTSTLVPALREALAEGGRPDIMIVVGGVIPPGTSTNQPRRCGGDLPPGHGHRRLGGRADRQLADSLDPSWPHRGPSGLTKGWHAARLTSTA